jgi:sulfur transfer complex TusBCD TusB component (DsrH family)
MKVFAVAFYLLWGLTVSSMAQGNGTLVQPPNLLGMQVAVALYDSATTESQQLYNGPQYYVYDSPAEEHQFFLSEEWKIGSVFYDGQLFRDVPLLYDIVKDQLVARYKQGFGNVALQSQKVGYFTLPEHRFVRVEADTGRVEGLRTGYYDQLYGGKTKIVARRTKERQQDITERKVIIHFPQKDVFYLYQDGIYHAVRSKKTVLAYLENQKRPLKKYLRENNLSFRDDREAAILGLAAYYDQLTNP